MLLNATEQVLEQVETIIDCYILHTDNCDDYYELNIGRHIRHITDHYLAFVKAVDELKPNLGNKKIKIDYNLRNRESTIETSPLAAQACLKTLKLSLSSLNFDLLSAVEVSSEINCFHTQNHLFSSNLERELLYLINHTIHHLAYIALLAKNTEISLPSSIGIAPSTLSYLREQA